MKLELHQSQEDDVCIWIQIWKHKSLGPVIQESSQLQNSAWKHSAQNGS